MLSVKITTNNTIICKPSVFTLVSRHVPESMQSYLYEHVFHNMVNLLNIPFMPIVTQSPFTNLHFLQRTFHSGVSEHSTSFPVLLLLSQLDGNTFLASNSK